ncbi:MAG: TetR/AcrR family transcriptional regulator [Chitinophagales bacterium]
MNKTKKKIILTAVTLFNENSIGNVRNQDIAEKAGVSLSNFNYHFKTKQDLVYAVCEYMSEVLEETVYGNKVLIMSGQGLEITRSYFEFEWDFRFFYLDTYNILQKYPKLKKDVQKRIKEALQIIKNLNYMAVGKGNMLPEPEDMPGLYNDLAEQIWISNHFLFAQMNLRGIEEDSVEKGLKSVFAILYPYLTEKGRKAYRTFIGGLKK